MYRISKPDPARLAITATFFLHAAVFTNWVPRVPAVQESLGLDAGQLALAFLGIAVGPLVGNPVSGAAAARFGSRPATRVALLAYCAALVLPALAPSLLALFAALFVLSASNGALAVAMNTHGVSVQEAEGKTMFSSFHAANSFGGLAGAGIGGLAAAAGIAPEVHLAVAGGVFAVAGVILTRRLLPASTDRAGTVDGAEGYAADGASGERCRRRTKRGPLFTVPSRALLGLGLLAFCVFLAESAVTNWSALYLGNALGASPGVASAGFVVFAGAMAVSRLAGDKLTVILGPVALTRTSSLLAAAGLGLGVLAGSPAAAIVGLGFFGAGLAATIPAALKAAGDHPGQSRAVGIAAVSTVGYFGFLAGPSAFGFVAELVGLPIAFGGLAVLAVFAASLAGNVVATLPTNSTSATSSSDAS